MKDRLIIQFDTLTVNTNAVVILVLFGSLSCLIYQPSYIILAHVNMFYKRKIINMSNVQQASVVQRLG